MVDNNARTDFEDIFKIYSGEIFRHAALKVTDRSIAEDIVASTFLRYWEKMSRGEKIANPRAFLYTIARGLVIDYYRTTRRRPTVSLEFFGDVFMMEADDGESLDAQKEHQRILEKLQVLKDEYREVIVLHYVEGLPVAEIAQILQESENNIRVRLHRALVKLREQFHHERY